MTNTTEKGKQIFWYNFANYTSYFLVLISIIFLYDLNIEIVGKIKYVESIAAVLMPFLTLGLSQAFVNFFPIIEDYHGKTLYGFSLALVFFISCLAAVLLIIINFFYPLYNFNFFLYGVIISSSISFLEIMKSRAITLHKVTRVVIFEKIAPKVFLMVVLLLFGKLTYTNDSFLIYYAIFYFVIILYLFAYLNKFSKPRFSFKSEYLFENFNRKDLYHYMFFSVLASSLSFLAFKVEGLIIPHYFSMKANGMFGIALFVSSFVALPAGSIFALNSAQVSVLIKNDEFIELNIRYKEVAKIIFYRCFIILSLVVCVVPQIIHHFYNANADYIALIPVIQILCIGSVFGVATGFNNELIIFSKYYKFNYFFTFILVIINLGLFYYFLKYTNFALVGIAISMSASVIIFNTIKLIFIKIKLDLNPLDIKYLILIVLMTIVLAIAYFFPLTNNFFIDISIKTAVIFILNFVIGKFLKLIDKSKII